jgi:hypothetical protein
MVGKKSESKREQGRENYVKWDLFCYWIAPDAESKSKREQGRENYVKWGLFCDWIALDAAA